MNIGIYSRKSIYSDKSDSTESQAKICKEYVNSNYTVTTISEYEDEGYTGANTNRPGFTRLMRDVLDKKIEVLICYKIDRISRNVMDFSNIFNTLQEHNIEFVSVKEQIDTSTPLGRAMMYICSVFAQMERETIAERVKDSMIELAKSGKWAGGRAPLGYKRERVTINGKTHTMLAVNTEELPLLNHIFETFLEGYSLNGLETFFRKSGIKSLNGNYFSSTQLYQILRNPHYVAATDEVFAFFKDKGCIMATDKNKFDGKNGVLVYGRTTGGRKKAHTVNTADKWIVTVGIHRPIISAENWLAVQNRFGMNIIDRTRKHEIGLLKGIVKCKCGYTMRTKHKVDKIYNKIYDHYFCQNRSRRGPVYCDIKMVSVCDLDEALINILKNIKADKSLIYEYIKSEKPLVQNRSRELIKRDIVSIGRKIENLTNTLHENSSSSAAKYIIIDIEKLDKQISGLNYELREVEISERDSKVKDTNIDLIYDTICEYLNVFETLDYDKKIRFMEKIITECTWDGTKLSLNF